MKSKHVHIILVILTSLHFYSTASAQRTMSGQPSLRVSSTYNGRSAGAEAFFEMYTLSGYWQSGIQGNLYNVVLSTGNSIDYLQALAQGGYMFRLASTRSRSLNLYAGGGINAGVEVLDIWNSLPTYMDLGRSRYGFIYGFYGSSVLEWFLSKRFAIILQAGIPVSFRSAVQTVKWNIGVGLKWNL